MKESETHKAEDYQEGPALEAALEAASRLFGAPALSVSSRALLLHAPRWGWACSRRSRRVRDPRQSSAGDYAGPTTPLARAQWGIEMFRGVAVMVSDVCGGIVTIRDTVTAQKEIALANKTPRRRSSARSTRSSSHATTSGTRCSRASPPSISRVCRLANDKAVLAWGPSEVVLRAPGIELKGTMIGNN